MRQLRLLALLAPALLLPAACEDSSGSSSGAVFSPEAGAFETGPSPDAGPLPDGALPDTSAPVGVTVTVIDASGPKKDVRVVFHDAAGAVTGQAVTDVAGKVFVAVAPSMVTVLTKDATQHPAAVTYAGVTDGDNLKVVVPSAAGGTPAGTYDVTFAAGDPLIVSAIDFVVRAGNGCLGSSQSMAGVSVPLSSDCVAAKNAVLVAASNTGVSNGFAFVKDVAAPVAGATVAIGPLSFTAPGTTTIKATNLPTGPTIATDGSFWAIAGGQAEIVELFTGTLETSGLAFSTPTGFADAYQSVVRARLAAGGATSERALARREATTAPASATLASYDFNTALPFVTAVAVAQAVPARPELTFTIADPAAMATADAAVIRTAWFATALDTSATWTFVVPPSTTSFKFPALPVDAPDFIPTTDSFFVDDAAFFDSSQLPSFNASKALPISPTSGADFLKKNVVLPAAGTLRVSRITNNG